MLTRRQNLMETISGGNPDRFVNQSDMGIDIWQGVMTANNTPDLIKKIWGPDFIHGRT